MAVEVHTCLSCGETRDANDFKTGCTCKDCHKLRAREAYAAGPDRKRCSSCNLFISRTEFRRGDKQLHKKCSVCEDDQMSATVRECRLCRQILPRSDFACRAYSSGVQDHFRCRACEARAKRAHTKTPEWREWYESYRRSEGGRAVQERQHLKRKLPEEAAKRRLHRKWRYDHDTKFRMVCCLRSAMQRAMHGHQKVENTLQLLGCTKAEFMAHIEEQFSDGMTWDNFDRTTDQPAEIDHIIPLASFDMTQPSQRRAAMNYRNCRPLWQFDNRSKSDLMPDGTRGRDALHREDFSSEEAEQEFNDWN